MGTKPVWTNDGVKPTNWKEGKTSSNINNNDEDDDKDSNDDDDSGVDELMDKESMDGMWFVFVYCRIRHFCRKLFLLYFQWHYCYKN